MIGANTPIILDANVLIPPILCDLVLTLAETPRLYLPKWSPDILDEVERNLPAATKLSPTRIASWRPAIEQAFPEALVTDYKHLIGNCKNHPGDRHVVAAALRANAHLIVTINLRHFRPYDSGNEDVLAIHPSTFLLTLHRGANSRIPDRVDELAARRQLSREEFLDRLAKHVPAFTESVRSA